MNFQRVVNFYVGLTTNEGHLIDQLEAEKAIVETLAVAGVDGFTLTPTSGYWHGQRESSLVVTVFCTGAWPYPRVAAELAVRLQQEAVLVHVDDPTAARLVYSPVE